jgi:hypothetical protein
MKTYPESVQREIDRNIKGGMKRATLAWIESELARLGYRFDKSMRAASVGLDMTSGESFPCLSYGVSEKDTGLSAFNNDARRDANFRELQAMRKEVFAVVQGQILFI